VEDLSGPLKSIYSDLCRYRRHTEFISKGRKLLCDIAIPSQHLIIEYDEMQHFTRPRRIALGNYHKDTIIGFDISEWIEYCDTINAKDNSPIYRDEQRAFYDSVRDLLAAKNGYSVVRIKHGIVDWSKTGSARYLKHILKNIENMNKQHLTKIVTVCIGQKTATQFRTGNARLEWLPDLAKTINNKWEKLDSVIFPGGFLRLKNPIGHLDLNGRIKALRKAGFEKPLVNMAIKIDKSPGVVIIAGIDGPKYTNGHGGDQLAVAWNESGIFGIGRKIFPVKGEEADCLVCYEDDFGTENRIIELRSGKTAILCACYDMFGVAENDWRNGIRSKAIKFISTKTGVIQRGHESFLPLLEKCISDWNNLISQSNCTVGISTIHGFEGHSTNYWQKHGIASCSAALRGGLAVAAAHFHSGLPKSEYSSVLAAVNVPKTHLQKGTERPHLDLKPTDSVMWTQGKNSSDVLALIRYYTT